MQRETVKKEDKKGEKGGRRDRYINELHVVICNIFEDYARYSYVYIYTLYTYLVICYISWSITT